MLLIRINLFPVLPLLVLYVFWEHGRKAGFASLIGGGLTVLIGHALFWPGILQMWAYWLPRGLTPFLDNWRLPLGYVRTWNPEIDPAERLLSLAQTIRFNFTAVIGFLTVLLLWPRKSDWKTKSDQRMAVFLVALFAALFFLHVWATLGKNYCVFCLSGYVMFFFITGLMLILLAALIWRKDLPVWRQVLSVILIIALTTGIGFGNFQDIDEKVLKARWVKALVKSISELPGYDWFSQLSDGKVGLSFAELRRLVPTLTGLLIGIAFLILILIVTWLLNKQRHRAGEQPYVFGYIAVIGFLLLGTVLTPTELLGGGFHTYDCTGNVLETYKAAGTRLAELVPPGSTAYWEGGLTAAPLLYAPEIRIFAPQINDGYSHYRNGDSDTLLRFGFWSNPIGKQWLDQADYALVQRRHLGGELTEYALSSGYEEIGTTPEAAACLEGSEIIIFQRNP
jgi:hypothetical protein